MTTTPDPQLLEGASGLWEIIIGLEVHAQVESKAKLFSGAATRFGAPPNTQVSLVDAAMPGMLPVINETCIEQAVRTGLGLNANINLYSVFDRKNYFYADLPQGYQISQYKNPIVGEGVVPVSLANGKVREVGIERLHLEQDAGKSLHDQHPKLTYVDLNRAGVALMEIVSKPDLRSAEEAAAYVRKLRTIMRYLGTCDGNMEEGSLRCDVNVSVRHPGDSLGTRCEIKNVNSIRFLQQAIEYESRRQVTDLEDGKTIHQETRLFDSDQGVTRSMRSKEEAHDYRYFPDPDLLPLVLTQEYVDHIFSTLPELPDSKRARFQHDLGISEYHADVLVVEPDIADYFEKFVSETENRSGKSADSIAQDCANLMATDIFAYMNKNSIDISDMPVKPEDLAGLQVLKIEGTISGRIAKEVFEEMLETGNNAEQIVKTKGLVQLSNVDELEKIINKVLHDNPVQLGEYQSGKDSLLGFFVGQVMKMTNGKANPKVVNEILIKKLSSQ